MPEERMSENQKTTSKSPASPAERPAADGRPAPSGRIVAPPNRTRAVSQTTSNKLTDEQKVPPDPMHPAANVKKKPGDKPAGTAVIKKHLKTLTSAPGVYRMIDKDGNVLYVGKARNLKNRVQSYTRLKGQSNRIARMIIATTEMEFVITGTESEALLLEATYIKKMRPRYNVLLRDDKSFPSILIRTDHEAPQIVKHRGARKQKGKYFGPFASAGAVNRTVNTLQQLFLLRDCSDAMYESRTRPCLQYQIKRCSGPCTGKISIEDYAGLVKEAKDFLEGKSRDIQSTLQKRMEKASKAQRYEEAAFYRDRISALTQVQSHQSILPTGFEEGDIFAIDCQGGIACIQVFFIRTGQNWGNRAYFPRIDKSHAPDEIMESFIAQFYDNKPIPKLVLTSIPLANAPVLAEALSTNAERKVTVQHPQRGTKAEIMTHAVRNAKEALARKMADSTAQARHLAAVGRLFNMEKPPTRIEVFDNSHIQGTSAIGAMIVAGPEGFVKNQYRKYNFKPEDLKGGDDFAMMRQMLTRRFKSLLKDHGPTKPQPEEDDAAGTGFPAWPDLLLIDGGKGQLSSVMEVMDELGIKDVLVVAISKGPDRNAGREQFHITGQPSFSLDLKDPALYFLQRLRDESHRFAIGGHRIRRKKQMAANPLDEIPGIGPRRKKALLSYFGAAKAVSRASLKDLKAVEGISAQMAETIFDYFNDQAE